MSEAAEKAILAGGCFWGMQDLIRRRPGVVSTRVGYAGGDVANETYRQHGTHAEAIEILFDPTQTSYRELLELYFQIHDPTTLTVRETTAVRVTARRSSIWATISGALRRTRSRTSTHPVCGPGRSSPR
jgi:methionine-S-sulfoxide reductase